jgi:hypothetical protein
MHVLDNKALPYIRIKTFSKKEVIKQNVNRIYYIVIYWKRFKQLI